MSNIESIEVFYVGYVSKYNKFGISSKDNVEEKKVFYIKHNRITKKRDWRFLFSEMMIKNECLNVNISTLVGQKNGIMEYTLIDTNGMA